MASGFDLDVSVRAQFSKLLPGWSLARGTAEPSATRIVWADRQGLTVGRAHDDLYELTFSNTVTFRVCTTAKTVHLVAHDPNHHSAIEHLLLDQVVPRILAHGGQLVVHGAGMLVDERLVIAIGRSGRGKSTLASWFVGAGHAVVGDDAMILSYGDGVTGMGLAAQLRVREDTALTLCHPLAASAGDAGYAGKVKFGLPGRGRAAFPVAAIFRLVEPSETIQALPVTATTGCMALVEESFALDPSDCALANWRVRNAARVAECVPIYDLRYPRRYDSLPTVASTMLDLL